MHEVFDPRVSGHENHNPWRKSLALSWAVKKLVLWRFGFSQVLFLDSLHVRPGLAPSDTALAP